MNLYQALKDAGCKLDTQAYRDLVKATFIETCKGLTDEDLYCDPARSTVFCIEVNRRARASTLPYEVTLRTLTNIRKRGELPKIRGVEGSGEAKEVRADAPVPKKSARKSPLTKAMSIMQAIC
jgi:hypothetical protein